MRRAAAPPLNAPRPARLLPVAPSRRQLDPHRVAPVAGTPLADCPRREFPARVQPRIAALFDLQVWCFGQDVRLIPGNGLVRQGFTRHAPPPIHPDAASCYTQQRGDGLSLALWSFGVYCGRDDANGGVYLQRFQPYLQLASGRLAAPAWAPEGIRFEPAGGAVPQHVPNVSALWTWLAEYEVTIERHQGSGYRADCVQRWHRPRPTAAPLSQAWCELAAELVHAGWELAAEVPQSQRLSA